VHLAKGYTAIKLARETDLKKVETKVKLKNAFNDQPTNKQGRL
jgi:hypothetical protein